MMTEKKYRLNDYIITEYDNHFYTWEMNVVLGDHRTGNCFIIGDILILQSRGADKNGCLKLEYREKLVQLPVWSKTRYYCLSDSLKDVRNGTSLSKNLHQTTVERYCHNLNTPVETGEYHMGLYKIIVNSDQTISWKKNDGFHKISKGTCELISGLLFIQSRDSSNDSMQSRKEWIRTSKSLPAWNMTPAWGRLEVLKRCNQDKGAKKIKSDVANMSRSSENVVPQLNNRYSEKEGWVRVIPGLRVVLVYLFNLVKFIIKKIVQAIIKTSMYIQDHFKN